MSSNSRCQGASAAKAKKAAVPDWAVLNQAAKTIALSSEAVPAKYPGSGTVYLKATVEGWAVPVAVKVSFSVKSTAPKLAFSSKTATLLQGSSDAAKVTVTAAPAPFSDAGRFPVTVEKIEVLNGKTYTALANPDELTCTPSGNVMTLKAPSASADGKAHTYKVTLLCAGKEFAYTVKTRASAAPVLTAKVSGGINTMIPESPVTVTLTPKNFHPGSGEVYSVEKVQQYSGKTLVNDDVKELFSITVSDSTVTFTEKNSGTLESGSTYRAIIGVDLNGDRIADGEGAVAALKVTFAKSAPAISVSAKKTGTLDVTRRNSAVTVAADISNWYGGAEYDLVFYVKNGKTASEIPAVDTPFKAEKSGGVFTITLKDTCGAATGAYSVKVKATAAGGEYWTKAISIPVIKGKVSVKSSVSKLTLFKNDRYSRAVFTLSTADESVAPTVNVALDTASAKKYQIVSLGNNTWGLEYKENTLPKAFKSGTVKLSVFVEGCDSAASTVSLKVNFK